MSLNPERYQEWLDLEETKHFIVQLEILRLDKLEGIIVNLNREEACGIVKGVSLAQSLLMSAKE